MALVKDEWVISKTSGAAIEWAKGYIRDKLDGKQEVTDNLDSNNAYIDNYFADLFDARDGSLYRIYAKGATTQMLKGDPDNGDSYYNVVLTSDIITQIENAKTFLVTADLTDYSSLVNPQKTVPTQT